MHSLTQPQTKLQEEWYIQLVSECKAIVTEAVYNSRWALVEGYWQLGKRMREDPSFNTKLLQDLAVDIKVSERTMWYALKAYDKYPDINKMPEGKNISWNKLVTKYLPKRKELKDGTIEETKQTITCPKCGYKIEI
jgi:hypothetical protein